MPIIQFDEGDKLKATVADEGFYPAVLKTCDMKASGSGKSVNFWCEFELAGDSKFKSKEIKVCFNTEVNSSSMLNGTQFRPYSDLLLLKAAIDNIPLEQVPLNFNTDDLLVKTFDLKVEIDTTDGVMNNRTGIFLPAGKATSASAGNVGF